MSVIRDRYDCVLQNHLTFYWIDLNSGDPLHDEIPFELITYAIINTKRGLEWFSTKNIQLLKEIDITCAKNEFDEFDEAIEWIKIKFPTVQIT